MSGAWRLDDSGMLEHLRESNDARSAWRDEAAPASGVDDHLSRRVVITVRPR